LGWRHDLAPEILPTGIEILDFQVDGVPRGRISEISGPLSSGRTIFLHRLMASAGARGEYCALVDAANAFDPVTARAAGVRLERLVWVRCGGNLEHAFKATDLLVHGGGFGLVALDLCDIAEEHLRRIPASYWFRFRRAIEPAPIILLVVAERPLARSCASLSIATERTAADFAGRLFRQARYRLEPRKPPAARAAEVEVTCV
jgi:hypothetical protein